MKFYFEISLLPQVKTSRRFAMLSLPPTFGKFTRPMAGIDELIPDCWLFDSALCSPQGRSMPNTSDPDLFVLWRKSVCPRVSQSDILRNYDFGIAKFELNFPSKFSEIRDKDSRSIRQDLVRTLGTRRREYGAPDSPSEGEDQRFIAILRVVLYLHHSHPTFRYRQGMLDLFVVPWHVTHSHFRNIGVSWRVLEANAAFLFFWIMTRTGQITRLPGLTDFLKRKADMEKLISERTPFDDQQVIKNVEMGMLTALKWMMTVFVQEFVFEGVVQIWRYVMADGPDGFEKLLAGLCGRALHLLVQKAKGNTPPSRADAIAMMLASLKDTIPVDDLLSPLPVEPSDDDVQP
jgi:hypothetical protein